MMVQQLQKKNLQSWKEGYVTKDCVKLTSKSIVPDMLFPTALSSKKFNTQIVYHCTPNIQVPQFT